MGKQHHDLGVRKQVGHYEQASKKRAKERRKKKCTYVGGYVPPPTPPLMAREEYVHRVAMRLQEVIHGAGRYSRSSSRY